MLLDGAKPALLEAKRRFEVARALYDREGLRGSPKKEFEESLEATVLGAEFCCLRGWARQGISTVSAPLSRRLSLSQISLKAASLPGLSGALVACLAGSWTAVFLYRRPLMTTLGRIFAFGQHPPREVRALSRLAADDLVLASVLAPLAATDLTLPEQAKVWATDASPTWGAVCSAEVSEKVARELWLSGDKRRIFPP